MARCGNLIDEKLGREAEVEQVKFLNRMRANVRLKLDRCADNSRVDGPTELDRVHKSACPAGSNLFDGELARTWSEGVPTIGHLESPSMCELVRVSVGEAKHLLVS
ncbi:hypothetical protein AAVH_18632 [Aphelenchoides avenae]|nr:hypothetical protein AAVH_18632 [Aphelenchus avenae]